ncbi:MAG: ATP-binding protein [Candidatus Krumholzibacteriia bacterium]
MVPDQAHDSLRRLLIIGEAPRALDPTGWQVEHVRTPGDLPAGVDRPVCAIVADSFDQAGMAAALDWARGQGLALTLAHRDRDLASVVRWLRAGLFDAVSAEDDGAAWTAALERLAAAARDGVAERAIRADAQLTQRALADSRRRLRHEAQAEADSLLTTQAELEAANASLSAHMQQISLLYGFGRELSHASNWDETLRGILEHLARFVGAVGGALVLRTAPGGNDAPRQTYRWVETAWDKVLLRINHEIDTGIASSLLAPGVFQVGRDDDGDADGGRITALPLAHGDVRLGMLLLLFADPATRRRQTDQNLAFLQMVQVMLAEEVAAAQMLDRLRDVSTFNTRLLETVSSAIWVCNGEGRTIFVNRAARTLLGYDGGEPATADEAEPAVGRGRMLERPLTGGAQIDDLPEVFADGCLSIAGREAPLFAGLQARSEPFLGEGHIVDAGGQRIPVRVRTAPMAGRGRHERWLLLVLEDMTASRRAEAARRRADQLESLVGMTATLAHEIRNPLMGLSAQAELLAESLPAGDKRRDRIDLITGEVERINRTITDMLQYVRPCQPRREELDLAGVRRNCLELARPRAEARGVALACVGDASLVALADPAQIQQVLLNLVLNAIDAAPEGGHVQVRLASVDALALTDPVLGYERRLPGLVLSVEDDGPGFGATSVEKLFQPFYTTKTTGTGLGLAYSRKVVEAHDGEIRAERQAGWTCMRVLLPRTVAASRALAGEAS